MFHNLLILGNVPRDPGSQNPCILWVCIHARDGLVQHLSLDAPVVGNGYLGLVLVQHLSFDCTLLINSKLI